MSTAARPSPLGRLRKMDAAELRFRASVVLRNAIDRARVSVSPPAWDRSALVLSDAAPEAARQSLARRDWLGAHRALAEHFQRRPRRFPLSSDRVASIARAVHRRFPSTDARSRAERILGGHYDLLGYANVAVGTPPDWHRDPVNDRRAPVMFWDAVPYLEPACGDHKVTWELNRHQHFLVLGRAYQLTGDERYYQEFVRQFAGWMTANSPLLGMNWASMLELAFRSLSWLWSLEFFAGAAGEHDDYPWLVDLLLALDRQLLHIEHNLSRYFSPNTHLSGEVLALYVAGRALPELARADRRADIGRAALVAEASAQINPDGGHAELSAHYHRYSTDFYLLALNVARITRDTAAAVFEDASRLQAAYLRTLATDDGLLPLLGDDDGGQLFPLCGRPPADCRDSLAHAALLLRDPALSIGPAPEETYWFCGREDADRYAVPAGAWPSRRFESSGYCVMRTNRRDHLVFDCGRHGFLNGGHAHSDALSIVLTIEGRPVLVDPGTGLYTIDPAVRDRFRGTAMHNTVLVDGRPQAEPRGAFHWATTTDAACTAWKTRPGFDYAEGRHEGYEGVTHIRRVVALHGIGWLVVDHLLGNRREVEATAMWHLHPMWTCSRTDERGVQLHGPDGVTLALASTAPLREVEGPEASYSPVYGCIEPAPCLSATIAGPLPLSMATFVPATADWLPGGIRKTLEPDTFEVLSRGLISLVSKPGSDPIVTIHPAMAESLHRSS